MGKIDSGILSGFRGKVGTVVGYFRGEQCIIRVHKKTINASKSLASLTNQSKFSLALRLVKLLTEPFRRGYSGTAVPSLWFSKALGAIVKNATEGSYPAVSINYAKLPFSDGPGTTLVAFTGSVAANTRQLTLNWDSEDDYSDNAQNDKVVLIALNSVASKAWYTELPGKRLDQTAEVMIPESLGIGTIYLYAYTVSSVLDSNIGRARISPSVFGGTVNLA